MRIERCELVPEDAMRSALWEMYAQIFAPINAETPIIQSLTRDDFMAALSNERVVKFIAYEGALPIGIAMITTDLDADPFVSRAYFERHYPGREVFYIMTMAVLEEHRGQAATKLLYDTTGEVSRPDGVGFLLHSEGVNRLIPRLAQRVRPDIEGMVLDREACVCFVWRTTEYPAP